MPLADRKEEESTQLKGVDLAADETKIPFGSFTSLQNWIPAGLRAIKKKRGPAALDGVAAPLLNLNFQDNFLRGDCSSTTPIPFVGTCAGCLTIDSGDNTLIAKSAALTVPCFCFYAAQLCNNNLQFAQAQFKGVIAGNPRSGVAVRIAAASTDTSFTGYGLLYDPGAALNKLSIVKWIGASLQTVGTVLTHVNTTLNANDTIRLEVISTGTNNHLQAYINGSIINLSTDDATIAITNSGVGMIVVGNTGADDRARWDNLVTGCVASPPSYGFVGTCPDTFVFSSDYVFGLDPSSPLGTVACPGAVGCTCIIPAGSVAVHSGENSGVCYGYHTRVFQAGGILNFSGANERIVCDLNITQYTGFATSDSCFANVSVNLNAYARYVSHVGNPRVGVCVGNISANSADNFTGYGLVIDPQNSLAHLVRWNAQSLVTFGTIIQSLAYVPTVGDIFNINSTGGFNPPTTPTTILATIYNAAQAAIVTFDVANSAFSYTSMDNAGVVSVGAVSPGALDSMTLQKVIMLANGVSVC